MVHHLRQATMKTIELLDDRKCEAINGGWNDYVFGPKTFSPYAYTAANSNNGSQNVDSLNYFSGLIAIGSTLS